VIVPRGPRALGRRARGAYEAGVLRYIREDLAGDLGGQVHFDIVCARPGRHHACFVAGTADMAAKRAACCRPLGELRPRGDVSFGVGVCARPRRCWRRHMDETDGHRAWRIVQTACSSAFKRSSRGTAHDEHPAGLPRVALRDRTDIGRASRRLRAAREARRARVEQGSLRACAVGDHGPEHAIASAALPILFPAVCVATLLLHGGLRQNTPLSPALRLGADKGSFIGLRHSRRRTVAENRCLPGRGVPRRQDPHAFLLDHID